MYYKYYILFWVLNKKNSLKFIIESLQVGLSCSTAEHEIKDFSYLIARCLKCKIIIIFTDLYFNINGTIEVIFEGQYFEVEI